MNHPFMLSDMQPKNQPKSTLFWGLGTFDLGHFSIRSFILYIESIQARFPRFPFKTPINTQSGAKHTHTKKTKTHEANDLCSLFRIIRDQQLFFSVCSVAEDHVDQVNRYLQGKPNVTILHLVENHRDQEPPGVSRLLKRLGGEYSESSSPKLPKSMGYRWLNDHNFKPYHGLATSPKVPTSHTQ